MIDLHYWPTPNGWKVTIMLEECGLAYRVVPVDIGAGEQLSPGFLRISPNNRMPAIVDPEPLGGGEPLAIFESGAILEYVADKTGRFLPKEPRGRYRTLQWVHWQMANLGPMMGNANHFKSYAPNLVDDPKQLEYATRRFTSEVERLCGVMDAQLSVNAYLAGDDYGIADMASWPWMLAAGRALGDGVWTDFAHVKRWLDEVGARPAVQKGWQVGKELREQEPSEAEQKRRREVLFGQSHAQHREARERAAREAREQPAPASRG